MTEQDPGYGAAAAPSERGAMEALESAWRTVRRDHMGHCPRCVGVMDAAFKVVRAALAARPPATGEVLRQAANRLAVAAERLTYGPGPTRDEYAKALAAYREALAAEGAAEGSVGHERA